MPNSRQTWLIGSPSNRRATNRRRSSITELSFHGIDTFPPQLRGESVTHVSGTNCHRCVGYVSGRITCLRPQDRGSANEDYCASVQLSENARAQVLNGRPSRSRGQGRPAALTPLRVSCAPNAGINSVQTP